MFKGVFLSCVHRNGPTGHNSMTRSHLQYLRWHFASTPLGCIYTSAKAKAKATSLPICYIVFNLCVYTTATAAVTKVKEKIAFAFASNINAALPLPSLLYNHSGYFTGSEICRSTFFLPPPTLHFVLSLPV